MASTSTDNDGTIEPLDDTHTLSDTDSAFFEPSLSTASLRSSIYDYEQEFGRSYHAFRKGKYVMPNDEAEQERMDIHYHSLRLTLENKSFISPIENPMSILDVGCGTGIWAMDVADDYPATSVLGIDLSPIQPTAVPPNLRFEVMDADELWNFHDTFDLVHTSFMNGFSVKSWQHFYEQAFKYMKPGGWVENQEFDLAFTSDDGTMPQDGAVSRWQDLWNEGIAEFGLTGRCYPETMKQRMQDVGFINVMIKPYKMPVGAWPRDKRLRQAGLFFLVGVLDGITGLSLRTFTHGLGWTPEQLEVLLIDVRNEWKNRSIHSYVPM